jgi:hypothetical protein
MGDPTSSAIFWVVIAVLAILCGILIRWIARQEARCRLETHVQTFKKDKPYATALLNATTRQPLLHYNQIQTLLEKWAKDEILYGDCYIAHLIKTEYAEHFKEEDELASKLRLKAAELLVLANTMDDEETVLGLVVDSKV